MRVIKILLLLALVLTTLLFGVTGIRVMMSDSDYGPSIACDTDLLEVSVTAEESQLLAGVTAWDAQDGDLTDQILIQGISKLVDSNTTKITYIVFDRHGNLASVSRNLRFVDYHAPRFSVTAPLQYVSGASMLLLDRLQVMDQLDGDITDKVRVSSMNSLGEPELYGVDLLVTNSLGDTARVTLPVVVTTGDASRPVVRLREYLVYLSVGSSFDPNWYLESVTSMGDAMTVADVVITGGVDTNTPGTYMVCYRCRDDFGTGLAVLTVIVE